MRGVSWNGTNRRWRAHLGGFGHRGYVGEFFTEAEAIVRKVYAKKPMLIIVVTELGV